MVVMKIRKSFIDKKLVRNKKLIKIGSRIKN